MLTSSPVESPLSLDSGRVEQWVKDPVRVAQLDALLRGKNQASKPMAGNQAQIR